MKHSITLLFFLVFLTTLFIINISAMDISRTADNFGDDDIVKIKSPCGKFVFILNYENETVSVYCDKMDSYGQITSELLCSIQLQIVAASQISCSPFVTNFTASTSIFIIAWNYSSGCKDDTAPRLEVLLFDPISCVLRSVLLPKDAISPKEEILNVKINYPSLRIELNSGEIRTVFWQTPNLLFA